MPTDEQTRPRPGITARQAIAVLGFSRTHIYRHATQLGAYRVGRDVRFDRTSWTRSGASAITSRRRPPVAETTTLHAGWCAGDHDEETACLSPSVRFDRLNLSLWIGKTSSGPTS